MTNVVIPNSVNTIGNSAFYGCTNLTNVYYSSTKSGWEGITIDIGNENLTNANIYYYSETKPTVKGNYWYYENGEISIWPSDSYASEGLYYTINVYKNQLVYEHICKTNLIFYEQ